MKVFCCNCKNQMTHNRYSLGVVTYSCDKCNSGVKVLFNFKEPYKQIKAE